MRMMRLVVVLSSVALALTALPASAVQITLSGPTVGPLTGGIGVENVSGLTQITFTIGLDPATEITGYDLSFYFDSDELDLVSASQLFNPPTPFTVDPMVTGSRAGVLGFTTVSTTSLFSLTFDVLSPVEDGEEDISVFLDFKVNGTGLSPEGLTIDNPEGAGIDVVIPEPATGLLVGLGLVGVALRRRS